MSSASHRPHPDDHTVLPRAAQTGVHDLILAQAQRTPDAAAVLTQAGTLRYGDLVAQAGALASALQAQGVVAGQLVGLSCPRDASMVVGLLGIWMAGAGYVPMDPAFPAERLRFMAADAGLRHVVCSQRTQALWATQPGLTRVFADGLEGALGKGQPVSVDPATSCAYVIYTSGSTGVPKGVRVAHRSVVNLLTGLLDAHFTTMPTLTAQDRVLAVTTLSFDIAVSEVIAPLAAGACIVLADETQVLDGQALRALVESEQVSFIDATPSTWRLLRQAGWPGSPQVQGICTGEPLPADLAADLLPRLGILWNGYGPTETTVWSTFHRLTDATAPVPIGLPVCHTQVHVLDEAGQRVPTGTVGELHIGGEGVTLGYLGREALSAERFVPDPFSTQPGARMYRSGDLGRWREDGLLECLGRIDQQIKVRGHRIEPGEIEARLAEHPSVAHALLVVREDTPGDARLVAYVVPKGPMPSASALRAHLGASLPDYMLPQHFVQIDAVPLLPNGKTDRRALPAPSRQRPDLALPFVAPRQPLEASVCAAFGEVLGLDGIGAQDSFFELGGTSLQVLRLLAALKAQGHTVRVADVYDRLTPTGLAGMLRGLAPSRSARMRRRFEGKQEGVAIVGMALRTPGADDVDTFWQHLLEGREGIRHFAPEELDASVPEALRRNPHFVAARGVMSQPGRFDAAFFGVPKREAIIMDPQQRHLLELSWAALEHAGIDPQTDESLIGVFAGTAHNTYLNALRQAQPELVAQYGEFQTMLANDKDYPAVRVAYRLNLHGPAISVHTACSTGLVAVAQAWHALQSGQCDVALAGGATLVVPQESGYLHVEGAMESADGHCRPFDAAASGTVFSNGAGMVVLKRLDDAMADGDTVYAVIQGVGVNNDGGDKASFTAPSVSGQAQAIRMALDCAQVSARQIGYVEAHGTGTPLGDPIEVAALSRAWSADTQETGFCTLGSVKGNTGHLIAAAGVVGLVKAALSLHHERIPGTLHCHQANAQLGLAQTPFVLSDQVTPWPRSELPRLAAVSSFGVGGTNAHAILQEAPVAAGHVTAGHAAQTALWLLPLSARSPQALRQRASDLARWLGTHPEVPMGEVVATLTRGRSAMPYRQTVVAAHHADAVRALQALAEGELLAPERRAASPRLVFVYPGQGSQHPGMAAQLYEAEPVFRDALERCIEALLPWQAAPWRDWLVHAQADDTVVAQALQETQHAQVGLFCMSYALGAWLESLGVQPDARIGHSIGEWAAACHAGVFALPDALRAVVARGTAMQAQPRGAMLAVRASANDTQAVLPPGVELAGLNAPQLTVVAGPSADIDEAQRLLDAQHIGWTRLKVSHAFHSASMEGALPVFEAALRDLPAQAPTGLVYSSLTGEPLRAEQATSAAYWAQQIRGTVRFTQALQHELSQGPVLCVEVGPGQALSALVRQHRAQGVAPRVVPLLGPSASPGSPLAMALQGLGQLWCAGVPIAWPVARGARRATLPTYPFQGEHCWFTASKPIEPAAPVQLYAPPHSDTPTLSTFIASTPSPWMEAPVMSRLPALQQELKRVLSDVSGIPQGELQLHIALMEQGLDSLSMTQATLEMDRSFGIKLRFRRLMEDLDTVGKLAVFLDAQLPPDRFAPLAAAAPSVPAPMTMPAPAPTVVPTLPTAPMDAVPQGMPPHLLAWQVQLIEQQLQLLKAMLPGTGAVPAALPAAVSAAVPVPTSPQTDTAPASPQATPSSRALVDKPFGASARITLKPQDELNATQRQWLADFIARYNARSGQSKASAQRYRAVMSDPRVVTGFNPLWKDLVYPIVVNRSKGNRLWDLDHNEYIDLLSCFGANILGYQPDDISQALIEQVHAGFEVGPQHALAGEVAELMSEFTGHERVAFCNTGSEAVMGAMRMARTVTGRKTIAIFNGSYHGIFDEVIVRGTKQLRSLSAAPGILASAVENVLVLDYGSDEALRVIRERGHELAAVLIEPVQSRNLGLQPHAFVRELRQLCTASGAALIFDEVITGFRAALGGAQAFYGVRADIATYGKVIGGGLPFAVIAGSPVWMDALDGGTWQFGDDSYPEAGVTYFAGTFVRHPLALAAAKASLLHFKRAGPALQEGLNAHTSALAQRLNDAFLARNAPLKCMHFASVWRLIWDEDQRFVSLFYYLLRYHGVHVYEQFGHFLTEAFTQADLDRIVSTFTQSLDELMGLGLIKPRAGTPLPEGPGPKQALASLPPTVHTTPQSAPLSPGQTERWLAARFDAAARRAINETVCLSLQGPLDTALLRHAVSDVTARHEAFRMAFDADEPLQTLSPQAQVDVATLDLCAQHPPTQVDAAFAAFCDQASRTDFALAQAPMARVTVVKLGAQRHVVHLVASHLVFDGWATSVFVNEVAQALAARQSGHSLSLPPAESPRDFGQAEYARLQGPEGQADLRWWRAELHAPPAALDLSDRTPPQPRAFTADTVRARIDAPLLAQLKATARQNKASLFQTLLTALGIGLHQATGQDDMVIGIPFASQSLGAHPALITDGVLDLPVRLRMPAPMTGVQCLHRLRQSLMDATEHPLTTQSTVARALGLPSRGDRPPLTGVFFNLNPRADLSAFARLPQGLQATLGEAPKRGLLSELFFNLYDAGDHLTVDLHHSTELFSPLRAQALVDGFVAACQWLGTASAEALPGFAVAPGAPDAPNQAERPDTELERTIALHMAEVLATPPLDRHADFFVLGGHSLLAAKLLAKLAPLCGQRLGLKTLFECPTVGQLADHILAHQPAPLPTSARLPNTPPSSPQSGITPLADPSRAPLSLMQQRLWFIDNMQPGGVADNLPSGHRLRGPLNVSALQQALQAMVDQQAALRTHIRRTDDGAEQVIVPHIPVDLLPLVDLSALPLAQAESRARAAMDLLVRTPFQLESGPLFALKLYKLAPDDHVLFFMTHHLIWDGWSFDLMYDTLSRSYPLLCAGHSAPAKPLPLRYGDFAAWQQNAMRGPEMQSQLTPWLRKFATPPAALALPTDKPRPTLFTPEGGTCQVTLSHAQVQALHQLAQAHGTTLYTVLLSVFTLFLGRLSQQDDIVIGTPVRGRDWPELEAIMGFFVNMLPLRMKVDLSQSFAQLLDRVKREVSEALANPDVPMEQLVHELKLPRDLSRPALYQVLFSFQDVRERPTHWGELQHSRFDLGLHGSAQDLGLWCVETAQLLEAMFVYNLNVFSADTARSMAERFAHLVQQVVDLAQASAPHHLDATKLSDFDLLGPADLAQLQTWNDTAQTWPAPTRIEAMVAEQAARTPQAPAVLANEHTLSYAELDQRANQIAHRLQAMGAGPGQFVGLCTERGPWLLPALLGVLKTGAAYVPLDPGFPEARLRHMAQDAGLRLIVTESAHAGLIDLPRDQQLRTDTDLALIQQAPITPLVHATPLSEQDPAYAIYTSGSTGLPKGVVLSQRAVCNFLRSMQEAPGLKASDQVLAVTTLSFDIAVLELLLPLTVGARTVIASRDDALDGVALRQLADAEGITLMQATPATWHLLLDAGWRPRRPGFKALCGGEALTPRLAQDLLATGAELWNMYGPTETTVWSTLARITDARQPITVGRPIANTQVWVLDAQGQRCPIGVPGELCIGGIGVALGYHQRAELTADRFVPNPFAAQAGERLYRTGDLAKWRSDGLIEHLGRLDHQVKVRGHRIELGEIEAQLSTHPAVGQVVVVVREDSPGDQRLVAYLVPKGPMPPATALREHLRRHLPKYMLPQHFVQLDAIPRLPNGKTNRAALPAPAHTVPAPLPAPLHAAAPLQTAHAGLGHAQASANESGALRTPTERLLGQNWSQLLGVPAIRPEDNFFDLGGHSLLAMQAISMMEKATGKRVTPRRYIFESLAQLAASYDATPAQQADTPTPPAATGLIARLFGRKRKP